MPNNFSWPGVYNPAWTDMQAPWNLGLGQGYSGNPQAYYNSSGGGYGMKSGYGGSDPFYGYGYLAGAPAGGGGLPGGTPMTQAGGMGGNVGQGNWNPNVGSVTGQLGEPDSVGNVTYSPAGGSEKILDRIFGGASGMGGGGPIGNMLYHLGMGQLPPALAEGIVSQNNEQFGKLGARFGTDLATANARGLAQASEAQSLNAIRQTLGLGGTTAGFQFERGENALNRAMQEFIAKLQTDPLNSILPLLLGGGGG